jgi:hypothetical protein
MKISRRMQRQVEIIIRHAHARDTQQMGIPAAVTAQNPQNEKAREATEGEPR